MVERVKNKNQKAIRTEKECSLLLICLSGDSTVEALHYKFKKIKITGAFDNVITTINQVPWVIGRLQCQPDG